MFAHLPRSSWGGCLLCWSTLCCAPTPGADLAPSGVGTKDGTGGNTSDAASDGSSDGAQTDVLALGSAGASNATTAASGDSSGDQAQASGGQGSGSGSGNGTGLAGATSSGGAIPVADDSGRAGSPASGSEVEDQTVNAPCIQTAGPRASRDANPDFSFFVTSMEGLLECAYGADVPSETSEAGLGAALGGLEGADAICAWLARRSNPGDNKIWRAFLSAAQAGEGGTPVHAIDRIGDGPWYDFNGRLFASDPSGIAEAEDDGRPPQADLQIAEMLPDEWGDPSRRDDEDNHDVMTGSNAQGMLQGTFNDTCQDWTFNGDPGRDVSLQVGHSWPRSDSSGRAWIREHDVRGCMPGVHINGDGGALEGDRRVGAGGGYGAFYCFASLP